MAVHEKTVHFHMLTKDGACRLRRKLVCPDTGKEYDFGQTARGIEIAPDDYVLVDQKEIDRLKPEKGRALEIIQFISPDAIDPVFYDNVYYLRPGKDAKKSYKLLVEAMTTGKKCALARFVMRERQYMANIRAKDDGLIIHTLHYADEVDPIEDEIAGATKGIKLSAAEMRMAGELIKSMTRPLHLEEFKDEFRRQLQAMIDAKAKGKQIAHPAEEQEGPPPRTINLMEALKKSLAAGSAHNGHNHNSHRRRRSA
jgi:DNA end-binding protein Ku